MLRIVFMGTPEFSVPALRATAAKYQVAGVFTQPDRPVGRGLDLRASPVKLEAERLGIPVFQPESLVPEENFAKLQALQPDVIVVVAFGQILKRNVLDLPRLGCVNIHSSLLPRWRGAAPIQRALLAGDMETGVTTMRIAPKLDAGDILLQAKTPISGTDTAGTLHDRLAILGADLLMQTLDGLESGSLTGQVQDESRVTYAQKLSKEMETLNPDLTAIELDRQVRALHPWPGTSVRVQLPEGPLRLKIRSALLHSEISGPKGKIFDKAGMILLGCSEGCLELRNVQWEGKREVDMNGFVNGLRGRGQNLPLEVKP
ncbi:MAG: methionyl-tRNA formyltransferase [Bdellovibrionales bacterium GWB1_55_8]|nr:MAG: methionyl-tRNA formyltransferase [Bdellovibrionales bacterium GWB1_55_8]